MQLLRRLSFTMLLMSMMTLVACGDGDGDLTGGGDGDGGGGDTPVETVLTITKSDGELSAANDITVSAAVANDGSAVANKTVTFTFAVEGSATFDPLSGTATTDGNGVATIVVKVTDMKGSVNVIATYENTSENISFDSAGDGEGSLSGGAKISIEKSEGDLSADNDITVFASILSNDTGEGVEGELVTFTLNNSTMATFDPAIGTAVTDASGVASILVKVTDVAGGVEVTASVSDGSDTAFTRIGFTSLGDGQGVPPVGSPEAASISLFASSQQLASSGAQSIELIAIAKDANNNLVEGVAINFAADSGSIVKVVGEEGNDSEATGPDGKISKLLTTLSEPSNRIITTTITSGSVTDTLEVEVVGTSMNLEGTSSLAINDTASYIIKLLDSDGNGIANATVALSLTNESTETPAGSVATITLPSEVTTDFNGQATVSVSGTSGGTNTIIATGFGATANKAVSVQADSFLYTNFGSGSNDVDPSTSSIPDILLSETASVTLTWLRSGTPVADGTVVNFTTTRGTLSSATATTVDGKVSTTLTSTNAGKSLVTFTGIDAVDGKDIELSNQLEFEFVADTASRLIAQASPNSIAPNGQTSTISVIVRDADGNLVKGKDIDFELDDVSSGSIFPASARTDSNGSASTVYTSNTTSSKEGINITATVRGSAPVISDQVTLTVTDREMFIRLGTGNSIQNVDDTTYNMPYSVFVSDIDSTPIEGLTLTVSAIPKDYHKGYWVVVLKDGEFDHYAPFYTATCFNEDGSNGGVVDGIFDTGEDVNNNGKLTPGNIVNVVGEVTTDAQGRAVIDIIYGEVFGGWADIDLIVSAKVNGSESFAHEVVRLTYSGEDVTDEGNPPATFIWPNSPFGAAADCTDAN